MLAGLGMLGTAGGMGIAHARDGMGDVAVCATVEACGQVLFQRVRAHKGSYGGLDREDQLLIERLVAQGPSVTPILVDLLSHPDEGVATLAAAALRDTPVIDRRHFAQIRAGLDRGVGWLAPALCRMDGDDVAEEAVARYLVSASAPHNQEHYAIKICGVRALPHLVEAARCEQVCERSTHYLLGAAMESVDDGDTGALSAAAAELITLASDTRFTDEVAAGMLSMVGRLGSRAQSTEPALLGLREARPALRHAVDRALVDTASSHAGRILAEALEGPGDPQHVLWDLWRLGEAGRAAGPAVLSRLDDDDWDVRVAAAMALGQIGYLASVDALVQWLDDPRDLRMSWAAARSLGLLGDRVALEPLEVAAGTHWYPAVRAIAADAVLLVRGGADGAGRTEFVQSYPAHSYRHLGADVRECELPALENAPEPDDLKLYWEHAESQLKAMAYSTVVLSYGPAYTPPDEDGSGVVHLTPDNMLEHRSVIEQVPHIGLRVDGGWLLGGNRGEWGGELVFMDDAGAYSVVLDQNIEDVYVLGGRIIALAGLAHLSGNRGMAYALERDLAGGWTAEPWRALPGAPMTSWFVETGEVLVNTASGGGVLLAADGGMRMVPCRKEREPRQQRR